MSEAVESVARAIHEALRGDRPGTSDSDINPLKPPEWGDLKPYYRALACHQARAAISAMREPTEAMKTAWNGPKPWDQDALEVWQAMIDEALK